MIARLQIITQDNLLRSHAEQAKLACKGGANWIQFRTKVTDFNERLKLAREVRSVCSEFGATLIINDWIEIAEEVEAEGIHLGMGDSSLHEARERFGHGMIIGASVNSLADLEMAAAHADYAGVGPLRFSTTKQQLRPILGMAGMRAIAERARQLPRPLPCLAIGGVDISDIEPLLSLGLHGIAVSAAVVSSADPAEAVRRMLGILPP